MQRSSCKASLKPTSAWCRSAYACSAGPAAGCSASAARAPPAGWPPGALAALPLPPAGTGAGAACARSCGMTSAGSKLSSSATRSAVRGSIFPYVRKMAWRTRSLCMFPITSQAAKHTVCTGLPLPTAPRPLSILPAHQSDCADVHGCAGLVYSRADLASCLASCHCA